MLFLLVLGIISGIALGILDGRASTNDSVSWKFIKAQRRALAARTRAAEHIVALESTREKEQINHNHALGKESNIKRYDEVQKELKQLIDKFDDYDFSKPTPQIRFTPNQMLSYHSREMKARGARMYFVPNFGKKPRTSIENETTWLDDISDNIESTCHINMVWRGLRPTLVGEE